MTMSELYQPKTKLTLEHAKVKASTELAWDTSMYELLDAFIGACITAGFSIETVDSVLEEYVQSVTDKNNDKTN